VEPNEPDHPRSGGPDRFLAALWSETRTPEQLLGGLVELLHSTPEIDEDLCREVGVGNLESLLRDHEVELWPKVEALAREDVRFRIALSSVWAYDSPAFARREALLRELDAI